MEGVQPNSQNGLSYLYRLCQYLQEGDGVPLLKIAEERARLKGKVITHQS